MVFLLIQFYFAIFTYIVLDEQVPEPDNSSLWRIYMWQYDRTFKNDGAVGSFLVDKSLRGADDKMI